MGSLKKTIAALIIFASLNVHGQDKTLMNAFSQSYSYEAAQKYDAAITELNTVYSPASYEINIRLGWLNYLAGKHKESVGFYQKAIALMPAAEEPLWAIINTLTKLESWNDIEKNYLAILKLDPKNASANYNLGSIYYYRKDYVNAKKYFDVSLNLYPFGYNNMLMSAWTNYFLGNKNEAITLFNKTLLYSPNDKSALEGLSLIK
ncbi:MAG: tetratricopeptide repeat protein [Bacteroidetes bacterium]|nr:tetratricopeptide repeat protein [Bacteroidota bacterium]